MRIKILFIFLFSFLLSSCTTTVKTHDRSTGEDVDSSKAPPKRSVLPFDEIDLEITDIHPVEKEIGAYNSSSPKFSSDEKYLAYEVNLETFKKIYIHRLHRSEGEREFEYLFEKSEEVHLEKSSGEVLTEEMFETSFQESFNYEFSWFPRGSSFIFTSNAGMGEYNIFVGAVEEKDSALSFIKNRLRPKRFGDYYMLTEELKKDGQARVSPDGKRIVFSSGRSGNGDLYLLDLASGELRGLTYGEDTDLYPQWSPDGRDIVYTTGGRSSHDIHVLRNIGEADEQDEVLVQWFFDDILPTYSPDGKYISFYTTFNKEGDPFNTKRWGLMIIPSDGSSPKSGTELIDFFHVADIIKDNSQATAWFPDSKHIIFAKNIASDYNPIYIYNIETREERLVETNTSINHDITVSTHGLVSFRAQVLGWDRIFIATTSYFQEYLKEN